MSDAVEPSPVRRRRGPFPAGHNFFMTAPATRPRHLIIAPPQTRGLSTPQNPPAMSDLRYPIGTFVKPDSLTSAERASAIEAIAETPAHLREAVRGLTESQLDTPYRDGGWTVRQVIHHVPDSHLNAYIRFKLALTEDSPIIKPYDESAWAQLADTFSTRVETSLTMLDTLHERWINLLQAMKPADFGRKLVHPERGPLDLDQMLAMYAWHGRHHVAHVTGLRQRNGW